MSNNKGFISNSVEWYTPSYILDYVKKVLKHIHYDPCGSSIANKTVRANKYNTDSLHIPWIADTVFCNPPYGKQLTRDFTLKMHSEYQRGNFNAGILLIGSSVHNKWFDPMRVYPICLYRGRIQFANTEGVKGNTHNSIFVYFGDYREVFREVFSNLGKIVD